MPAYYSKQFEFSETLRITSLLFLKCLQVQRCCGIEKLSINGQSAWMSCEALAQSAKVDTPRSPSSTTSCHEQPQNVICQAFKHAHRLRPPSSKALELRANIRAFDKCARSVFDDRLPRRHTIWTPPSWVPNEETGEMGREQGLVVG